MLVTHAFRLLPGQDLKHELARYCQAHSLQAAVVVSGVGSLQVAHLRLADAAQKTEFAGPLEIVSLTGTLSMSGLHLHISVADAKGQVFGGHLLEGCSIHTTAEIVLLESPTLLFHREEDPTTGYRELQISLRK